MKKRSSVLIIIYVLIFIGLFVVFFNLDSFAWSDFSKRIFNSIFSMYGVLGVFFTNYLVKKSKKNIR